MLEGEVGRKIMKKIRESGGMAEKINSTFTCGMPDIYSCKNGEVTWIEVKHIKKMPVRKTSIVLNDNDDISHNFKSLQKAKAKEIIKSGAKCFGLVYAERKFYKVEVDQWCTEINVEDFLKLPVWEG